METIGPEESVHEDGTEEVEEEEEESRTRSSSARWPENEVVERA
jgi:hypothetical protein